MLKIMIWNCRRALRTAICAFHGAGCRWRVAPAHDSETKMRRRGQGEIHLIAGRRRVQGFSREKKLKIDFGRRRPSERMAGIFDGDGGSPA
ncbi:hypothetical protein [Burkholderia glumae]|uniref:hypothetical protein n=1 Tax=Burkholderia glumae TaxID=337 RepID=UPI003B9BEFFF